jgi:hypothetical protein
VRILWFRNHEQDYFEFFKLLSLSALWSLTEKNRRCHGKDLKRRYGADGHVRKSKCMVRVVVVLSAICML